jgi:16S rRNA (uracil1498-N3)-methyltransferase
MYQFFIEENQLAGEKIRILGSDVNHIKNVLRMKQGTRVRISVKSDIYTEERCGNAGRSFFGTIDTISDTEVWVAIEEEDVTGTELRNKIYLFQGLPKGDKMELIIQKAVELGVYEIIPVAMKNCVVKLDDKKAKSKIARWQGIAEAAAKQSKRGIVPQVSDVVSFAQAIKRASDMNLKLIPYELAEGMDKSRELLAQSAPGQDIAIFIGPEGGFEEREIEAALEQDIQPITLGKRILRTETAGLAVLSWLVYQLEQ